MPVGNVQKDRPGGSKDLPTVLVVAAALFDSANRVLITKRPEGKMMAGLWEFPGGKVDRNELPEEALIREIKEELGIDISKRCVAPFTFSSYSYETFHLIMLVYVCRVWEGEPEPREKQELKWVTPISLANYPMPPADEPVIALMRDFF